MSDLAEELRKKGFPVGEISLGRLAGESVENYQARREDRARVSGVIEKFVSVIERVHK